MEQTVIVRYGEISLKSEPVREKFEKILINNIHSSIENLPHKIIQNRGRIFVETQSPKKVAIKLSNVPGIVSTSPAEKTESKMSKIKALAKDVAEKEFPDTGTFAINARRAGTHSFSSTDIEEKVGSEVLKIKPELEVDLESPEQELYVEAREKSSYIFVEKIRGIGGLPVGCQGKTVNPYIGNVTDSTISSLLLLKRGSPVYPLLFGNIKNLEKPIKLLKEIHPNLKIATIDVQDVKAKISERVPDNHKKIIREKIFLEISEKIANKIDGEALVSNKKPENHGLKKIRLLEDEISIPVLHPLAGIDEGLGTGIENRVNKELDEEVPKEKKKTSGERMKQEKVNELMERIRDDISYGSVYESLNIQKAEEIEWT